MSCQDSLANTSSPRPQIHNNMLHSDTTCTTMVQFLITFHLLHTECFWLTEWTRQAMYVQRNIRARSCNHCCSGKAMTTTYSERVSVALVIQHEMRMHHLSSVAYPALQFFFSHYPINGTIFKNGYRTQNVCFDLFYNFCLQHSSF